MLVCVSPLFFLSTILIPVLLHGCGQKKNSAKSTSSKSTDKTAKTQQKSTKLVASKGGKETNLAEKWNLTQQDNTDSAKTDLRSVEENNPLARKKLMEQRKKENNMTLRPSILANTQQTEWGSVPDSIQGREKNTQCDTETSAELKKGKKASRRGRGKKADASLVVDHTQVPKTAVVTDIQNGRLQNSKGKKKIDPSLHAQPTQVLKPSVKLQVESSAQKRQKNSMGSKKNKLSKLDKNGKGATTAKPGDQTLVVAVTQTQILPAGTAPPGPSTNGAQKELALDTTQMMNVTPNDDKQNTRPPPKEKKKEEKKEASLKEDRTQTAPVKLLTAEEKTLNGRNRDNPKTAEEQHPSEMTELVRLSRETSKQDQYFVPKDTGGDGRKVLSPQTTQSLGVTDNEKSAVQQLHSSRTQMEDISHLESLHSSRTQMETPNTEEVLPSDTTQMTSSYSEVRSSKKKSKHLSSNLRSPLHEKAQVEKNVSPVMASSTMERTQMMSIRKDMGTKCTDKSEFMSPHSPILLQSPQNTQNKTKSPQPVPTVPANVKRPAGTVTITTTDEGKNTVTDNKSVSKGTVTTTEEGKKSTLDNNSESPPKTVPKPS